jgi:hypothetical protein
MRVALVGELPAERRALLAAELQDLRLPRVGVRTPRILVRLNQLGLGPTARGCFGVAPKSGATARGFTSARGLM